MGTSATKEIEAKVLNLEKILIDNNVLVEGDYDEESYMNEKDLLDGRINCDNLTSK